MKNCINVEDIFVGDVKYCIDRREAYPGEEHDLAIGDVMAKKALVLRFEDRFVPFYMISDESDFKKILFFASQGELEKCGKRAMLDFPKEVGDTYVENPEALTIESSSEYLSFGDIKNLDNEWSKIVGDEEYCFDQLEL